jgi:hypothetical protein
LVEGIPPRKREPEFPLPYRRVEALRRKDVGMGKKDENNRERQE